MLVFFIHGVATRDVKYADDLKELIRQEFIKRNQLLPDFYSSFWGDVLSDVDKMWNCIYQDVELAKKKLSSNSQRRHISLSRISQRISFGICWRCFYLL